MTSGSTTCTSGGSEARLECCSTITDHRPPAYHYAKGMSWSLEAQTLEFYFVLLALQENPPPIVEKKVATETKYTVLNDKYIIFQYFEFVLNSVTSLFYFILQRKWEQHVKALRGWPIPPKKYRPHGYGRIKGATSRLSQASSWSSRAWKQCQLRRRSWRATSHVMIFIQPLVLKSPS